MSDFYYDYAEDSFLLLDSTYDVINNNILTPSLVIEIGSGSGYVICELLKKFPNLMGVAIDISYYACKETMARSKREGVSQRLSVISSSFDYSLRKQLPHNTLFLFNPPYLPANSDSDAMFDEYERLAYVGGIKGWETGFKMVEKATIERGFPIIIIYSTLSGPLKEYLELCRENNLSVRILRSIRFEFEELYALLVQPSTKSDKTT